MSPTSQRLLFTGPFNADHHARALDALGAKVDAGARDILYIVASSAGRRRAIADLLERRGAIFGLSVKTIRSLPGELFRRAHRSRARRRRRHRRRSAHRARAPHRHRQSIRRRHANPGARGKGGVDDRSPRAERSYPGGAHCCNRWQDGQRRRTSVQPRLARRVGSPRTARIIQRRGARRRA